MTVYKLDRFSRNKYEMAIHRKHLKDNGISRLKGNFCGGKINYGYSPNGPKILITEEKTPKAIANMMNAIKRGILTETTKQSLEDCENTKRELSEKIFAERAKIKPRPARDQIRNYILSALKKPTKQMIDLLIHKIVIFNDKIEITFKYIHRPMTNDR